MRDRIVDYYDKSSWTRSLNSCFDADAFNPDKVPRAAFIKDKNYQYQDEIRCCWETWTEPHERNINFKATQEEAAARVTEFFNDRHSYIKKYDVGKPISPIIINVPESKKYTRRIA